MTFTRGTSPETPPMPSYAAVHIVHLLCAVSFAGVVFFEVLILEGMRRPLGPATTDAVEIALVRQARRIMPFVVGILFLTGGTLAWHHRGALSDPFASAFGTLLTVKIALALSVLAHFINAMLRAPKGRMTAARFRRTHISVGLHMVAIIVLAKLMFYV